MALVDKLLHQAMDQLRAGRPAEAGKFCRDMLRVEPEHARAHCLLGLIAFQQGETDTALALLERAGTLNPRLPDVPRALAEVFTTLGRLEAALEAQRRATRLNPREATGHLQEAVLLQRLERNEEAEAAVKRALTLNPETIGARQLLASLHHQRGDTADAARYLADLRRDAPRVADPNHQLALCLLALGRANELADLPPAPQDNQRFGETMVAAIAAWLAGEAEACRALADQALTLAGSGVTELPNRSVFLTYHAILEGLLAWRDEHADAYPGTGEPVHVIGDSHVLSYGGLAVTMDGRERRLVGQLAFGCKAWHLVREAPSPYRGFYRAAAERIPRGATVIAAFGELDCRYKQGLMRVMRRDPSADWRAMTDALVARYVAFMVEEAAHRGWTLWLASPPMSNVNTELMKAGERKDFLGIIGRFNGALAAEAEGRGLPLLDVHGATSDDQGRPRFGHYIDSNHVRPTALLEAFAALRL